MKSEFFTYNGERSSDHGVYLINLSTDLSEENFMADKALDYELIPNNPVPYVYGYQKQPFIVTLTLALSDNGQWTFEKKREISRWFDNNNKLFNEFACMDEPHKMYYLTHISSKLNTTGRNQGYLTATFQNISCYTYSGYAISEVFDFSNNATTTPITFTNYGDNNIFPDIYIEKVGDGDISLVNTSNGGLDSSFIGLKDKEEIKVDCETRLVTSSLSNVNRLNDFNQNYMEFVTGNNYLVATGKFKLQFEYRVQFKI